MCDDISLVFLVCDPGFFRDSELGVLRYCDRGLLPCSSVPAY